MSSTDKLRFGRSDKRHILVLVQVYLPGYLAGGPVRSVANLIDWLGDEFEWSILTTDRDLHATKPYPGVVVDRWIQVGKAKVFYASPSKCSTLGILRLLKTLDYDLLYINSFFSPKFSVLPIVARWVGLLPACNILLAPRGEFSQGARRIKSIRKTLFIILSRLLGFHRVFWHASTDFEAKDILRTMAVSESSVLSAQVFSARDLVSRFDDLELKRADSEECSALRVCFLSRVSPMKNLDYALKVLRRVTKPVMFDVYGPKEDLDYWAECERQISQLPKHVSVSYRGAVENSRVRSVLSQYDLFLLPTRGENFGHVLLEAWSAGVPVLTSDQTPWRSLEHFGVGWDFPLDSPESFSDLIDDLGTWGEDRINQMRVRCADFARHHIRDEATLAANRHMFTSALTGVREQFNVSVGVEKPGIARKD